MNTGENVQIVKDFFAAIGRSDRQAVRALSAEDIEWIIPGADWPLAGTRDWRICFRRHPRRWKLHSWSPGNS